MTRPAFCNIGSHPRSGTTALLLLLNSDPGVYISNEQNILGLAYEMLPWITTQERRGEKARELIDRFGGNPETGLIRAASRRENHTLAEIHRYCFSASSIRAIVRAIYEAHHTALQPEVELKLYGDQMPASAQWVDCMWKMPLDVKYIHMTRNPYDVANSILRRNASAENGTDWWEDHPTVEQIMTLWNYALDAGRAQHHRRDAIHVRYEEMMFERPAFVRRLEDFFGFQLDVDYPLVSDKSQHFEREYIDDHTARYIEAQTGWPRHVVWPDDRNLHERT